MSTCQATSKWHLHGIWRIWFCRRMTFSVEHDHIRTIWKPCSISMGSGATTGWLTSHRLPESSMMSLETHMRNILNSCMPFLHALLFRCIFMKLMMCGAHRLTACSGHTWHAFFQDTMFVKIWDHETIAMSDHGASPSHGGRVVTHTMWGCQRLDEKRHLVCLLAIRPFESELKQELVAPSQPVVEPLPTGMSILKQVKNHDGTPSFSSCRHDLASLWAQGSSPLCTPRCHSHCQCRSSCHNKSYYYLSKI